jgi:hypothetical protein
LLYHVDVECLRVPLCTASFIEDIYQEIFLKHLSGELFVVEIEIVVTDRK